MIQANELRIGNTLQYLGVTVDVLEIQRESCVELGYFETSVGFQRSLFDNDIQPIPLTEEWLLKFGFEFSDFGDEPPYESYTLNKVEMWDFNGEYWICNLIDQAAINTEFKYVHQLQNLYFALTGEELTIK